MSETPVVTTDEAWKGTPRRGHGDDPATWAEVQAEELEEIARIRAAHAGTASSDADAPGSDHPVPVDELAGLAFSGGGIRSATFNLGIAQALAQSRLLERFDYLSTVSGGGYIGSWLTRAIRERNGIDGTGASDGVGDDLRWPSGDGPKDEPRSVNWLRRYSNYLTPKVGMFTADTWTTIATYVRNFLLNLVVLVSLGLALMLVPRVISILIPRAEAGQVPDVLYLIAGLALGLVAILAIGHNLSRFAGRGVRGRFDWVTSQPGIQVLIVLPLFLTAVIATAWLYTFPETGSQFDRVVGGLTIWGWAVGEWLLENELASWTILSTVLFTAFWLAAGWLAVVLAGSSVNRGEERLQLTPLWRWAPVVGAISGMLLFLVALFFRNLACVPSPLGPDAAMTCPPDVLVNGQNMWLALTVGPPLILLLFGVSGILHLGLMGRYFRDRRREWMARSGAWQLIYAIAWLGLVGTAFYGPILVIAAGGWIRNTLTIGWLVSTIFGVLAAQSALHGGGGRTLRIVARVAPYVFIVGFVAALSLTIDWGLAKAYGVGTDEGSEHAIEAAWDQLWVDASADSVSARLSAETSDPTTVEATFGHRFREIQSEHATLLLAQRDQWPVLLAVIGGLLALGLIFGWRVDINEFSMHRYYRNRLVRCYLGASNDERREQQFTGFDGADDIDLASVSSAAAAGGWGYPFHIVNATLNLVQGGRLAWQERKAAAFAFTPLYCGYDLGRANGTDADPSIASAGGGFRPTEEYGTPRAPWRWGQGWTAGSKAEERGISLGTAVAISGAAASPNMGFRSTPALSFLMTVFNVRLGWWLGNPARRSHHWKLPGPALALGHLVSELFGLTNAKDPFVYLSDGGHFENLGLYELVRRRCKYIVCCDVGGDGSLRFADLGNAIRKCYTDFGAVIHVPVDRIRKGGEEFSPKHFAVGTVEYPTRDGQPAMTGQILYIKSSMTGDEPTDVLNYHTEHEHFPHQSTGDQWFDESQFESYRSLGHHIGSKLFRGGHLTPSKVESRGWEYVFKKLERVARAD